MGVQRAGAAEAKPRVEVSSIQLDPVAKRLGVGDVIDVGDDNLDVEGRLAMSGLHVRNPASHDTCSWASGFRHNL